MRRGGARALLRAGLAREVVRIWGRWSSEAVGAYLEEVALEAATDILATMLVNAEGGLSAHALEKGCNEQLESGRRMRL